MNITGSIQAVINTLNTIPVFGVENMNRMLGSIHTLAEIKEELERNNKTDGGDSNGAET